MEIKFEKPMLRGEHPFLERDVVLIREGKKHYIGGIVGVQDGFAYNSGMAFFLGVAYQPHLNDFLGLTLEQAQEELLRQIKKRIEFLGATML